VSGGECRGKWLGFCGFLWGAAGRPATLPAAHRAAFEARFIFLDFFFFRFSAPGKKKKKKFRAMAKG